ncbi:MFS general substrate transporter [Hortaea werneckii]|nr:MFS general substrate transporter [Hortaea werneckii]KAI7099641.1 MFS general substrate transporter [Hortaea werneckii]KAI7219293.1 MFS general substrate transporter [Hortaea werneckii]KAI7299626.1 MFS general substrate transporter [Hortaea werneckii]KAI7386978.1 MFS general substrate transporter [Hortaea werneckii]
MAGKYSPSKSPKLPEAEVKACARSAIAKDPLLSSEVSHTALADGSLAAFYEPIDTYEGRHRYDPNFEWEPAEERRLVRKIDYRICPWVCLMFFALQLDRGNISQALSDNMLDDLGLTTNDYNTGQTIFYLTFLFAELPSQLISKKIGPDNWIPIQMVSWSLVASMQAFLTGRSSFWACRALLGLIEGGFIPDNILYLSYWYTGPELPIRLSFFWVSYQTTSIISAFMAFGILHMRGINGLEGWRWLFALEGMLTGIIGIVSYFYIPPSPTQTASRFRGKHGWFNEREEKILVNRVLRDDPSKGDMHNRQALTFRMFWECLCDWHVWPIYLIGLSWMLPSNPMNQYITLTLKSAGFGTFETNLLTIPAYVIFIVGLLFWTWLSEKLDERFLLATVSQLWVLPLLIALLCLSTNRSPWVSWILAVLLYAQPYVHAILVAITSRNAGSVRTRTVASAIYNMCVQASNIIGSNIYRTPDKPYYFTGNKILLGLAIYNMALFVGAKVFYIGINRARDRQWNGMSKEEKEIYLSTTEDKGNKRLDFRFAH